MRSRSSTTNCAVPDTAVLQATWSSCPRLSQAMGEQHHVSSFVVCSCVVAWIANGVVCVLLNKQVLFYDGFRFPMTLAAMHMVSAFVTSGALIHYKPEGKQHLPPLGKAKPEFLIHLVGIAALYGIVLVTANSAFIYLSVPMIQMIKVGKMQMCVRSHLLDKCARGAPACMQLCACQ